MYYLPNCEQTKQRTTIFFSVAMQKNFIIHVMRKNIILFFMIFCVLFGMPVQKHTVYAKNYPYAKVTLPGVGFYRNPIASGDNLAFYVEQSYYVKLLENEVDGFYKAQYYDEVGYVQKKDLVFVEGVPANPYPSNISFRVFSLSGLNMRSTPIESGGPFNIITTIPYLENNLMYYGKTQGEEAVLYKGNVWYYAKYLVSGTDQPKGYLYSVFCDLLTTIPVNVEQLAVVTEPYFESEEVEEVPLLNSLPQSLQILLVLGVSLPCVAILYFLFKPTKISVDNGKNRKIKKLKGSDYYEFED